MRYLLLSVLVVCVIGVMVIPNASAIQYNIKEGTTVQYKVDSTCEISVKSETAKLVFERRHGGDLESYLKSYTCDDPFQFLRIGPADRYFWDTVSTISFTVLSSSSDGGKFPDGKYGYNVDVSTTMKNGEIQKDGAFINFGKDWEYGIPSNLEVGDIIGYVEMKDRTSLEAKITDRKIMTVGGTPYVILIASVPIFNSAGDLSKEWKYFYEKESGMMVGQEETITATWERDYTIGEFDRRTEINTSTASTSVMFTNISTAKTITESTIAQPTQQPTQQTQQQSKGGGCLIATAAFGSEMAPQVQFLRELRDNTVLQTESGTSFMTGFNQFYYSFSPAIADYERENPAFKEAVKITLTPLLASLTLLQYADIDSESEMLGYGIGVILLNIGMYFVAPAVLIMAVRKRI